MLPNTQARKKRNSSKINLVISVISHIVVVVVFLLLAAHEGLLGEKMEQITSIQLIKEEKPPQKPKPPEAEPPKPSPPKNETTRTELPKNVIISKPSIPSTTSHVVAPPPAEMPSLDFGGGKIVDTSSDPVQIYKSFVEYAFHSRWNQPDNVADDSSYVTEVEISVNPDGEVSNPVWKENTGDKKWSDSIQQVIATVTQLDRLPPTNFPPHFTVIFNVRNQTVSSDSELQ